MSAEAKACGRSPLANPATDFPANPMNGCNCCGDYGSRKCLECR